MKSISVQEMRALEEEKFATGLSIYELMERVGRDCAKLIESKLETGGPRRSVLIFAGPGNNGGDGIVAAKYLKQKNEVYLVVPIEPKTDVARAKFIEAKNKQIKIISMDEASMYKPDVVVDALLGIGARLPLRGEIKEAAKLINAYNSYKISIDVPTGMDADSGETDPDFIKPDVTIALHAIKTGMEKAGVEKTGEIFVLDIGLND
jgi:NAD(P)H-hydrate epimerase